ncbi:reprolysin-like metallopeptidase [Flavobacterium sp. U410]
MKKTLLFAFFSGVLFVNSIHGQNGRLWTEAKKSGVEVKVSVSRESFPVSYKTKSLDLLSFRNQLSNAPERNSGNYSTVVIELPNANGGFDRFRMYEASNFESELQAQFPEIRSYVGEGIDDKTAILRLSSDPKGIQTVVFRAGKRSEFIEPVSTDGSVYAIYEAGKEKGKLPFTCSTQEQELVENYSERLQNTGRSSSGQLLTMRLALSCTAEYSNYFGATNGLQVNSVLAAFNATMTRVNGVFEKDFAIHLNIIANTTNVIYYNPSTDPYSALTGTDTNNNNVDDGMENWNSELQSTLTSVIGESNYDVGHLFGASGGGGNAGCIGCVCVNGQKGSGYTSPANDIPEGDTFDIDYVAHELGHQFGANHTFSYGSEGAGVNMEVGSGSTIMGYAGITNYNVQAHSDDYFHAVSIAQVQANMTNKTCPTVTAITHGAPVVNAGANYTIPKSTPFMLTGSATDVGGGTLTYCWEQYDNVGFGGTGAGSAASATKTTGPNWRSYNPTISPVRYFPTMSSIMAGSTTTQGDDIAVEALSSVARTLNFRLTVRDNVLGQGQTGYDNAVVTVDDTKGPLTVTSQNADNLVWTPGTAETITWDVNNTNTMSGATNVDILLSTDGGQTWGTTLVSATANDGSETITVPNVTAANCRVMVKASANVFFNVNVKNIAIGNYTYQTQNICEDYVFNFGSYPIPESSSQYTGYSLSIDDSFVLTDVNINPVLTHSNVGNLYYGIRPPWASSGVTRMSSGSCSGSANIDLMYDSEGSSVNCSNTISGAATTPLDTFTGFNGNNGAGSWLFFITDVNVGDGVTGTIEEITLNLCHTESVPVLAAEAFETNDFVLYPNPNNGSFNLQLTAVSDKVAVNVYDMRGRLILSQQVQANGLVNEAIQLNNAQAGIYLVTIEDGARKVTKKIVVE